MLNRVHASDTEPTDSTDFTGIFGRLRQFHGNPVGPGVDRLANKRLATPTTWLTETSIEPALNTFTVVYEALSPSPPRLRVRDPLAVVRAGPSGNTAPLLPTTTPCPTLFSTTNPHPATPKCRDRPHSTVWIIEIGQGQRIRANDSRPKTQGPYKSGPPRQNNTRAGPRSPARDVRSCTPSPPR